LCRSFWTTIRPYIGVFRKRKASSKGIEKSIFGVPKESSCKQQTQGKGYNSWEKKGAGQPGNNFRPNNSVKNELTNA